MKKRGFTLIELLAVILILGIIALIAIPTVTNIITESKRGAFETSANNIVGVVEAACELQNLKGEVLTTTYTFTDGNVLPILNIKGKLPTSGIITVDSSCNVTADLSNGTYAASKSSTEDSVTVTAIKGYTVNLSLTGSESIDIVKGSADYVDAGATAIDTDGVNLTSILTKTITKDSVVVDTIATDTIATYEITYSLVKHGITYSEKRTVNITYAVYANGTAVYFNPVTGLTCTSGEVVSTTGTKTGCMKWYAFNDGGSNISKINLILDHNTTALVAWNSTGNNTNGPTTLLTKLASDTASWSSALTVDSSYNISQKSNSGSSTYTLNYTGYKARLITADEIAKITNNTAWTQATSSSSAYFFDSKTIPASTTCTTGNTTGCSYGWLYDRTHQTCKTTGCLNNADASMAGYGYWTSSANAGGSIYACNVNRIGALTNYDNVSSTSDFGVRPVITLSKANL